MKSTVFGLDITAPTCIHKEPTDGTHIYEFIIPTLPAFAIEYYTLQYGAMSCFPSKADSIENDKLIIHLEYNLSNLDSKLVIHYYGIRDYKLLFPFINNISLQERLGHFYREAEITFENGSWLSFMLMCGAIFEGILFAKLKQNKSFKDLIDAASQQGLIDTQTKTIMTKVREYRNLVHANRHTETYVSQIDAMDTRVTLDKLIKG
ncbi:DUF4145 domain-containing protein [Scytonema sp. UIC 10036]|uniref:DUF4145 domain-containing protein n=1 Tax=Scytonema sp. UIC 10036 TaxID=2304196 RepID=UPI0012DA1B71|nr:DUF4145 domain-containing protein [Scytonema sp. UIC 10036]MUH00093.1 DUF4145 domain-containing protein [Scytonema sp. UIC 10036]